MTWQQLFTSSIGKKFIMAFSGIFLILFLIVHVGINACIFANDGGEIFNNAAHFMATMIVIRIMEWGLFAGFLLHIIQGLVLWSQNSKTRNVGYNVKFGNRGSTWYSRSMGLLGTIVLFFLIVHLGNFWYKARFTEDIPHVEGTEVHNMFSLMQAIFSNAWIVLLYVVGCISLAYHLMHGFKSAFRTFGMGNRKYISLVKGMGMAYSIIIPLAFAMMPIAIYFNWVK